jgi:L-lactate dehydrogenase (cytochrome)
MITNEELSKHNTKEQGLWVLINGHVYDVTNFLDQHPGKPEVLIHFSGKDGSDGFNKTHPQIVPQEFAKMGVVYIGEYSLQTNQ